MSMNNTIAAPAAAAAATAAVTATPVPVPPVPPLNVPPVVSGPSWPNDTSEQRKHRIAFYAKLGILLDPTSSLSFEEQVLKFEARITDKKNLMSVAEYKSFGHPHSAIAPAPVPVYTSTFTTTEYTSSYIPRRVVHSCNFFDAMVDVHYEQCHGKRPLYMSKAAQAKALIRAVDVTGTNINCFLSTCPLCHPTYHGAVAAAAATTTTQLTLAPLSGTTVPPQHQQICQLPAVPMPTDTAGTTPAMAASNSVATITPSLSHKRSANAAAQSAVALKFVHHVKVMVDWMKQKNDAKPKSSAAINTLQMLPTYFLQAMMERLLAVQHEFGQAGKPTKVDIAYHYTQEAHMPSIKANGLLTLSERNKKRIKVLKNNGATYGDGVYTSSNPFCNHGKYGNVGLLVARLLGSSADYTHPNWSTTRDSSVAMRNKVQEIVVVAQSTQCVPILQFDASQVAPNLFVHAGNKVLYEYHEELQMIVDRVLNGPSVDRNRNVRAKPPQQQQPAAVTANVAHPSQAIHGIRPVLPSHSGPLPSQSRPETLQYVAPKSFKHFARYFMTGPYHAVDPAWKCPMCHVPGQGLILYEITACEHTFHDRCLFKALKKSPCCPCCDEFIIGRPIGKMPSGSVTATRSSAIKCAGYNQVDTICIDYKIPGSVQNEYHPSPGVPFGATERRAFVPATADGLRLVRRLRQAFCYGLTFTVGVSQTTGNDNVVTWASIPHKTSPSSNGAFGYPDPNYIAECNAALDKLGVPKAALCMGFSNIGM